MYLSVIKMAMPLRWVTFNVTYVYVFIVLTKNLINYRYLTDFNKTLTNH